MAETNIKVDVEIPDLSTLPDASPSNPLEALSWLGESVEEVAEGLRVRGIKGKLTIANACPLANYLGIWWPNTSIYDYTSAANYDSGYYFCETTPGVPRDFICKFDKGHFPDLIDNG